MLIEIHKYWKEFNRTQLLFLEVSLGSHVIALTERILFQLIF